MPDNSSSLVPGRNPTGGPLGSEGTIPQIGSTSGANPYLPPTNLPAGAPSGNPYSTTTIPTFGANSGPYTTTNLAGSGPGGTNPVSGVSSTTPRQQGRTLGELQTMYGEGLGSLVYQFLQGGAGFNQDAINNLFAAMQPGINRGEQDLLNQFSTSGNRFGSGAQIGTADYLSQVNLNEGQIESQMYEQAISNYMNMLTGVSTQNLQLKEFNMAQPGAFDDIVSLIGALNPGGGSKGPPAQPAANVPTIPTSSPSPMPGDTMGLPSGNLPTTLSPSTLNMDNIIASLTGGGAYDPAASAAF